MVVKNFFVIEICFIFVLFKFNFLKMATSKFLIRSKADNAQIYIKFSVSRNQRFETKTGLTIHSNDWSLEKSFPKQTKAENKAIAIHLTELSNFIQKAYNTDFSNGIVFSTEWLKNKIDKFFNRSIDLQQDDLFSTYISNYIELRKIDSRTKKSTDLKFIQLQKKFEAYEKFKKRKFLLSEIDSKTMIDFKNFLTNKANMMDSSALTRLRNIKTVLLDAQNNGKNISHQIRGFSIENPTSLKVFLNFDEIEKIKSTIIIGNELNIAKDWLIIGCNTGQRISDLLRMNKDMIYTKTDKDGETYSIIDLTQEKTSKEVSIPLNDEVMQILEKYNGNFPPIFGKTKDSNFVLFNRYIKKVCQIAGINNIVKGKVFNDELKKNEIIETEKFNLVSSHICRRSFATNYYGNKQFTTPQLMAITGHKTESVFLSYIGKTSSDHALQTAKTFREIEKLKKEKIS